MNVRKLMWIPLIFFIFLSILLLKPGYTGNYSIKVNESNDFKENMGSYNVILIVVDCLRKDHIGYHGYGRNTTPNMDAFAAESLVFDSAFSQSGWTSPSMASIFTSLYPSEHGVEYLNSKLSEELITLPEIFQENGYSTIAVITQDLLKNHSGFQQGFDTYINIFEGNNGRDEWTSDKLTKEAIRQIPNGQFFMWIQYFDPHSTYFKHDEFDFGNSKLDRYDSEVKFVDANIGILLKQLKEKNLFENSIIIITSDHGEEFLDHTGFEHATLFSELLHIPLFIRIPEVGPAKIDYLVNQIDFAPTILELVGIGVPLHFRGENMLNQTDYSYIFSERNHDYSAISNINKTHHAIIYTRRITQQHQSIIKINSKNKSFSHHFFNLIDDPYEKNNLYGKTISEIEIHSPVNFTRDIYENHDGTEGLDENTLRRLEALGYLS